MEKDLFSLAKDFLITKLNPSVIIVFGSYAKGNTHPESDLDIAYFSQDNTAAAYDLFIYAQELADLLGVEVDLVNISEASTVFQAQIFSTGKTLYCKDDYIRMQMEMKAFSMYSKLNEERLPILNQIDESGSVYEE